VNLKSNRAGREEEQSSRRTPSLTAGAKSTTGTSATLTISDRDTIPGERAGLLVEEIEQQSGEGFWWWCGQLAEAGRSESSAEDSLRGQQVWREGEGSGL